MFTPVGNNSRNPMGCSRPVRPRRLLCLGMGVGLAVAALVLVLGFGAQPAFATDEDIQVVREEPLVKFPDAVDFGLTIESTSAITKVRLFFRPLGARSWIYAYPSFKPVPESGNRTTANLQVNTTGDSYLPPGTRLEYYYVIQDAAGNVLKTSPSVLEFNDDRFQWEKTRIGPLVLNYHDLPASRVSYVKDQVDGAFEELTDLLQVTPEVPLQGVIYNNRDETRKAFPFQSETISEAGVFQGFAFSSYGIFVGVGLDPRLITHETAHLLLHQALGPRAVELPAWLNEGFASYMEPGSVPYGSSGLRDRGLPIRSMSRVPGTPSHIGLFYLKSESVVGFLINHQGAPAFQRFLEQLRLGRQVDEALMQVYGFDTDGLEALWAAKAEGPQAPEPRVNAKPSPFLYLDVWGFGGLVLLVFLTLGIRSVYRRVRGPAPAEGSWEGDWAPLTMDDTDNVPPR